MIGNFNEISFYGKSVFSNRLSFYAKSENF